MTTALIVPAAGKGERLGSGQPKALAEIAGRPMLVHAVHAALASGVVGVVAVAAPPGREAHVRELLEALVAHPIVVTGGPTRRESVAAALSALPPDVDRVLVHDAARCLTPPEVFVAVAQAVADGSAAVVPGVPVPDTVKEVAGDVVTGTPDRTALRAVQTPQGFLRETLEHAHATDPRQEVTDDAGMVEHAGGEVRMVSGHEEAFKVTRPLDMVLAEAVLARRAGR